LDSVRVGVVNSTFTVKLLSTGAVETGVVALSVTMALKLKVLLFVGEFVWNVIVLLPPLVYIDVTYEGRTAYMTFVAMPLLPFPDRSFAFPLRGYQATMFAGAIGDAPRPFAYNPLIWRGVRTLL
jgi:hypothetical protein